MLDEHLEHFDLSLISVTVYTITKKFEIGSRNGMTSTESHYRLGIFEVSSERLVFMVLTILLKSFFHQFIYISLVEEALIVLFYMEIKNSQSRQISCSMFFTLEN